MWGSWPWTMYIATLSCNVKRSGEFAWFLRWSHCWNLLELSYQPLLLPGMPLSCLTVLQTRLKVSVLATFRTHLPKAPPLWNFLVFPHVPLTCVSDPVFTALDAVEGLRKFSVYSFGSSTLSLAVGWRELTGAFGGKSLFTSWQAGSKETQKKALGHQYHLPQYTLLIQLLSPCPLPKCYRW